MEGKKFDSDKPRWDLVPIKEMEDIVKALTHGAKKYAPDNWKKVDNGSNRYYSALMRHLCAWKKGEMFDDETGLPHLAHAGACLLFMMGLDNMETELGIMGALAKKGDNPLEGGKITSYVQGGIVGGK